MKSAGCIRQLDPSVVSRIAAGETISCPSNAIKELIENSIDANSTRIIIEVERGGYDLIRIIDNGCGINNSDLPIACKAHTTSKISDYSDLQRINTFGFRGEALHSISMVTHLKIITMTEKDELASVANYNEGELIDHISYIAATRGTTIEARNLFYNYSIRLQNINPNSEAKKITDVISKYSVIYPQISFIVRCNSKETLMTYGQMSSSESVLKLLFGFDDVHFFRCNFELNGGVYVDLFLSEPNAKVKKKTNALFINGRLVKNDFLQKSIEEAYTQNSCFGSCCSLQFSFIRMTIPPSSIDVNVHPKKEKVSILNEREIVNDICQRVKSIVDDRSKKSSGGSSKSNSIVNSFFKKPKEEKKAKKARNNQTVIEAFGGFDNDDFENPSPSTTVISQANPNNSFSTKNCGAEMESDVASENSMFSLNLQPSGNSIDFSHKESRAPTTATTNSELPFFDQKKIESLKGFVGKKVTSQIDNDYDDGEAEVVSSMPIVSSESVSPVRNSLFAAFNPPSKSSLSQLPPKNNSKSSVKNQVAFSQKTSPKLDGFRFLSDEDSDEISDNDLITTSKISARKNPASISIVKEKPETKKVNAKKESSEKSSLSLTFSKDASKSDQAFKFINPLPIQIEQNQKESPSLFSIFSNKTESSKPHSQSNNESPIAASYSSSHSETPTQISQSKTELPIQFSQSKTESPTQLSQSKVGSPTQSKFPVSSDMPIQETPNDMPITPDAQIPRKRERISLLDLIDDEEENNLVITDLPSFAPDLQKVAIVSIEKKNIKENSGNSSPSKSKKSVSSPKAPKISKGTRLSLFDDLKYDPSNSSQLPSIISNPRHRTKTSTIAEDGNMKKLEDLFSNYGDNMKRKFRVVKLISISNLRKKREEEADLELKRIFQTSKLELVGFDGTRNVIFTASPNVENQENDENEEGVGIVPVKSKDENKLIFIFNLFSLMKDLLIHKFLELFSNLPTFNVELNIDEMAKQFKVSFDEEMRCLEDKKDMLLEYFSIFFKNGAVKAMPEVIRGYRPSFAGFPLFLKMLVRKVDWEDETNCFQGIIEQLACLYSILPNVESPKIATNLLLQFKVAVLPELSDEGYLPNCSLRDNGAFVVLPMPPSDL